MNVKELATNAGRSEALKPVRRLALQGLRMNYRRAKPVLPFRSELPYLLDRRGLTGVGVEIGVKRGDFSEWLLSHWSGRLLVSIDPWYEDDPVEYHDTSNVAQVVHEDFYAMTVQRLERFGERSSIWRTTSVEGAERARSSGLGPVDFVYIDARHDYESVLEDLAAWAPLMKAGGVMAGHDYLDGEIAQGTFGVKRAVNEFFSERYGLAPVVTFGDSPWPSWVVTLPA
jgi:hypothetical protein